MEPSAAGRGSKGPVYAVIFAGGAGVRMNTHSTPKQFLQIHGKTILQHTLQHFSGHPEIEGVVVVCLRDWLKVARREMQYEAEDGWVSVVPGGSTTQESVYNGLKELERRAVDAESIVLVHDAVRPLISGQLLSENIATARERGNAITVAPEVETVVTLSEAGEIDSVLERSRTRIAKAPQAFTLNDLTVAHDWARREGRNDYIDSASLMRAAGHDLHPVEGPAENIKVTTPTDYYILRAVLDAQEAQQVFGLHMAEVEGIRVRG